MRWRSETRGRLVSWIVSNCGGSSGRAWACDAFLSARLADLGRDGSRDVHIDTSDWCCCRESLLFFERSGSAGHSHSAFPEFSQTMRRDFTWAAYNARLSEVFGIFEELDYAFEQT